MKITVEIAEVWKRPFEIEIPDGSPESKLTGRALGDFCRDAAEKMSGDGCDEMRLGRREPKVVVTVDDDAFEYSQMLEKQDWTVRKEDGSFVT